MFQFPPYASHGYFTHHGITGFYSCGVSPFGHMRVNALLAAHRTLSWPVRPSSPACPKASILCPESLIVRSNRVRFAFTRSFLNFLSKPCLTAAPQGSFLRLEIRPNESRFCVGFVLTLSFRHLHHKPSVSRRSSATTMLYLRMITFRNVFDFIPDTAFGLRFK